MADSSGSDRTEAQEQIMQATYRALSSHGYADLTIKHIAEEYGKSTAAVHYHYDTKEDLLAAFLDYVLDWFVSSVHEVETTDPEDRLDLLLDRLLAEPDDQLLGFMTAMLEMRGQAPYVESFADRFQQNDEYTRYLLSTVIVDGIDEGVFADVDADDVADGLMTIVDGARTRAVVLDDPGVLAAARQTADEYVQANLYE